MKKLILIIVLFSTPCFSWDASQSDCDDGVGTTFCVPALTTTRRTIDGDTYCDGVCDSSDTIYLQAGTHGCLEFQDFDGGTGYITITNEDSVTRVTIDINCNSSTEQLGGVRFDDVKYVDFRGDGYSSHSWTPGTTSATAYGIYVLNENVTPEDCVSSGNPDACCTAENEGATCYKQGNVIWMGGQTDHLKTGYIEITENANYPALTRSDISSGIHLNDSSETSAWTWEYIEIHHIYTHDISGDTMYIGENDPGIEDNPYTGEVLIHDNLNVNLGGEGIIAKGKKEGTTTSKIYNNIVKNTHLNTGTIGNRYELEDESQCTGVDQATGGIFMDCCTGVGVGDCQESPFTQETMNAGAGIRVIDHGPNAVYHIYNNYIANSNASGIWVEKGPLLIYNNIIANVGKGLDDKDIKSHGILVAGGSRSGTVQVYDNIIVDPDRYGILNKNGTMHMERNWIGGAPYGELYDYPGTGDTTTEGTGADANEYNLSVAAFNFNRWSDDSDYSNDVFLSRSLSPIDNITGISRTTDLSWTLAEGITGVTVYFEGGDSTPDVAVITDTLVETYDPGTLSSRTYFWQIVHHGTAEGDVAGDVYQFRVEGRKVIIN